MPRRQPKHKFDKKARFRAICITLNNPEEKEEEQYAKFGNDACTVFKYFVGQKERGDGTDNNVPEGTIHLQCYGYAKEGRSWTAWKKLFEHAHIERAKANAKINTAYCTKVKTRVGGMEAWATVEGMMPTQGQTNMSEAREDVLVLDDAQMFEKHDNLWSTHYRALQAYRNNKSKARKVKTHAVWIWGPSGTGKSVLARKIVEATEEDFGVFDLTGTAKKIWGDGCNHHKAVLVDDVGFGDLSIGNVMRMCGDEAYRIEYKGGSYLWNPEVVVFTSNYDMNEIWGNHKQWDALSRRVEVRKLKNVYKKAFKRDDFFDTFFDIDKGLAAAEGVQRAPLQPLPLIEVASDTESEEGDQMSQLMNIAPLRPEGTSIWSPERNAQDYGEWDDFILRRF